MAEKPISPAEYPDEHAEAAKEHAAAHGEHTEAVKWHPEAAKEHSSMKDAHKGTQVDVAAAKKAAEHAAQAHDAHAGHTDHAGEKQEEHFHQSLWNISYNKVRGPLFKLMLGGAILLNPPVAASIYATKKALDLTLAKVPVAGTVYNEGKKLISDTAHRATDLAAAVITGVPTIPLDAAENIYEGITNMRQPEAKGLSRAVEIVTEKIGGLLRGGMNVLGKGMVLGKNIVVGSLKMGGDMIKHLIPIFVKHPVVAPICAMGLAGGLSLGAPYMSKVVWDSGLGILQGVGSVLKGLGSWLGS